MADSKTISNLEEPEVNEDNSGEITDPLGNYQYTVSIVYDNTFRLPALYFRVAEEDGSTLGKDHMEQALNDWACRCGIIEGTATESQWWKWNSFSIEVSSVLYPSPVHLKHF